MLKIKAAILLTWLAVAAAALGLESPGIGAQVGPASIVDPPDIEALDRMIQKRFLESPGFGGARLVEIPRTPQPLQSNHVRSFHPKDESENSIVGDFKGWDVGMYLFGRWTMPDEKSKKIKYRVSYKGIEPIPVTPSKKKIKFPDPKKISDEMKDAFSRFQATSASEQKPIEFARGDWRYFATPVRVANQSCLQCHTDYVFTERTEDRRLNVRKKKVGDVNGLLVYALRRQDR